MNNQNTVSNTKTIISTDPSNAFQVLGEVDVSTQLEINAAVQKARLASKGWQDTGIKGRVSAIKRVLDVIKNRQSEIDLLTSKEMGKPISQSRSSTAWSIDHLNWYLENAEKLLASTITLENEKEIHLQAYEAYGVAAVITPWNFPLSNFVMGAVQTLLAGNTVVYKISEEVPLFGKLLDSIIADSELPDGVFSQVYGAGDVGELLAQSDIDLLFFTGSSAVGQKLYQIAAQKFIPCILELGGSDAGIVFEDTDIDASINDIFWAKFINNGQICCGLKRLLVEESRIAEVTEKLQVHIAKLKVGLPTEEDVSFGPLVAKRQVDLLAAQVEDAKAKGAITIPCLEIPAELDGAYYPPTLLVGVKPNMRAWTEELFGPVLSIIPFKTEQEAIAIANATAYGLSGYVFTKDLQKFSRVASELEAGSISLNGCDYSGPHNSFGGYKKSGLGKTGGAVGFRNNCRIKAISRAK